MTEQPKDHHIRSFVNRENRLPKRIQKIWDEDNSKFVCLEYDKITEFLDEFLADSSSEIIIEIGSGQGNQIVHAAKNNPQKKYIAFEVYQTGIAHTLLLMKNENVSNIRIIKGDAYQILKTDYFRELATEIWTFFPDPWPKKRHHKRRLITEEFQNIINNTLQTNGKWRIATDWENYAKQIELIAGIKQTERYEGRIITNFENKAILAKREIFDFIYQKPSSPTP